MDQLNPAASRLLSEEERTLLEASQGPTPEPELEDELGGPSSSASRAGRSRTPTTSLQASDLKPIVQQLLQVIGFVANMISNRRRGTDDQRWLMDEMDLEALGQPAASLAARHAPEGIDGAAGDVQDLVGLALGTGGYVIKNSVTVPPGEADPFAQAAEGFDAA